MKKCEILNKNTLISISANNRGKIIIDNCYNYEIYIIDIDNCEIIKQKYKNTKRCDYIVRNSNYNINKVYLIELKGRKIEKAFDQILSTKNNILKIEEYYLDHEIIAIIISDRVKIPGSYITKKIQELKKSKIKYIPINKCYKINAQTGEIKKCKS